MIDDPKDPPGEKRARRLEKVHRNSKNLLTLINDILDISKIEADCLTLDRQEVDVAGVIKECAESIQPLIKGDRVELRCRVDDTVASGFLWTGDAIRARQIVTNLLGNAAKFTESGHIELRVKTDAGSLVIEAEDTGIGIAPEHLSTIFEEFEQVDSSSTRRAGGTGLGLSISRKLCKLMGGEVTATSTPGVGSCFTATLPIKEPQGINRTGGPPDADSSQNQDEPRWAKPAALLQTIPGIGLITSMTILAELGELTRFHSRAAVANYAGLVPRQRNSDGKRWSGRITRQGSCHLRSVLIEAAWMAAPRVPVYAALFDRGAGKKNKKTAIVAVARRMLEDAWMLLIKDEAFRYVPVPVGNVHRGQTRSSADPEHREPRSRGPQAASSVAG